MSESILFHKARRRAVLLGGGAFVGVTLAYSLMSRKKFSQNLFSLGVASGEPLPDGVVLWTRLAPEPLHGGGMSPQPIPVQWEVAVDEQMRQIIQRGTTIATPNLAHSVHVEVNGLEPNRWYWYRFQVGNQQSLIGRTRTAPALRSHVDRLSFAFASCQHYEHGYYTAYRDMATAELDFVVHLGDYIYEGAATTGEPRRHDGPELVTLEQYRDRYALYKTDLDLQAAHAAFPWIVTWDDHEVDSNYANLKPTDEQSQQSFLQRRANAYQAYYEHMPLRRSSLPQGADLQLYRRFTFGGLAEFNVLDTRQYRSNQPCGGGLKARCAQAMAAETTLLGSQQERWLLQGLVQSNAQWNVLAQQVMMAQFAFELGQDKIVNLDQWDGYVAARRRLLQFLSDHRPSNPIVITGDIHSSWVHDLKVDFDKPESATIATEFVGTSITSNFSTKNILMTQAALPSNPHTKFFNGSFRGYVRCHVTPYQWHTEFRSVEDPAIPNSVVHTLASFVVEAGQPGAQRR
ncbi:MAG TPA: alkaline phosphatase D family protein [Trichocoleus sp.]